MKPEYRVTRLTDHIENESVFPPEEGWELVGPPTVIHHPDSHPFFYFTWRRVEAVLPGERKCGFVDIEGWACFLRHDDPLYVYKHEFTPRKES